jgi:hypothetical protein
MPNYLISYSDHKVVLRNYEGYITTYEEPPNYEPHDRARCAYCQHERPEPGQSGVLGLLEGERMWIEPKGFEEVHTRGVTEPHRLQSASKWVPYGVGAIEGQVARTLPVLHTGGTETNAGIVPAAALGGNGAQTTDASDATPGPAAPAGSDRLEAAAGGPKAYGPGEEPRPREGEPTGSAHGELL